MFSSKKYKDLGPQDFKEEMDRTEDAVLIDCRTMPEVKQAALEYDVHIDVMSPTFFDDVEKLDKSKSYFIYCRSGNRSGQMCNYMASKGFEKLVNLRGGIISWSRVMNSAFL